MHEAIGSATVVVTFACTEYTDDSADGRRNCLSQVTGSSSSSNVGANSIDSNVAPRVMSFILA